MARLPDGFFQGSPKEKDALDRVLVAADLLLVHDGRRRRVLPNQGVKSPFIEVRPLQDAEGEWIESALGELTGGFDVLDDSQAAKGIAEFRTSLAGAGVQQIAAPPAAIKRLGFDLSQSIEPRRVLGGLPAEFLESVRFYRLAPTMKWFARQLFWRALTAWSDDSTSWRDIVETGNVPNFDLRHGVPNPFPIVVGPMVARHQPLAAGFMTAHAASLVAIPTHGTFQRYHHLGVWPVGHTTMHLGGSGEGVYDMSSMTVPAGFAEELFESVGAGANTLLELLTDPTRWERANGEIELTEASIAQSTTTLGLDALLVMGDDWAANESIWTAFRSLTTLEGLLERGPRPLKLHELLDPAVMMARCLPAFPQGDNTTYATDLIRSYEHQLDAINPGREVAINAVRDVRNLVHGTGSLGDRGRRLHALRLVSDQNIQLVRDIAGLWWSAVVLSPETLAPVL